jgi:hypothetical protein
MMNYAPDVAKSSPLIAVRPRNWSPACQAASSRRSFSEDGSLGDGWSLVTFFNFAFRFLLFSLMPAIG